MLDFDVLVLANEGLRQCNLTVAYGAYEANLIVVIETEKHYIPGATGLAATLESPRKDRRMHKDMVRILKSLSFDTFERRFRSP